MESSRDLRRLSSSSSSSAHDAPPPPLPPAIPKNVQVALLCRPFSSRGKAAGHGAVVQCKPQSSEVAIVKRKTYTFDRVFGQHSTQKDVFDAVTGTCKTYTMQGDLLPGCEPAGIIPRTVRCIFDALGASGEEFSVRVSFLQLYNEELKDLLDPDADKELRLMENAKKGGFHCVNLLELTATTAKHAYELVNSGVKNRVTSETLMNENSSRSHSVFTIRIHSKEHNAAGEELLLRVRQLNRVDLAGSECVGRSGARNARAREAGTINQSLLTLDSLDETLSTLECAFRAKYIENKPELNQKMTKSGLLNDFESEIETLRAALRAARLNDGVYFPLEQLTDMQERLSGEAVQLTELEDILKEVGEKLAATQVQLSETKQTLAKVSNELQRVQVVLKAFQDNEQVLLANGLTAAKLYDARQKQTVQLLTKIESTQRNDETNTELATSYRSASPFQINSFLERLATHKESREKMFTNVLSALRELQTTQSSDLHGLVTNLRAVEGVVEANRLQATQSLAEDDAQKSAQREEVANSMKEQQQTMQEQLKKLVEMYKYHAADESRAELGTFLVEQSKKLQELQAVIDTSCVDARGTSVTSGFTDAKSVVIPSKLKKAGVSGMHNKKSSGVAVTNRSMKVPSAGATYRKTTTASSIAAPKRYRAKSLRGDPSSHGR
ncbi:unnamed protein product [Hyaloperonospora brassicae]|uniref:Kinesin motor domain-containing protein n=1 Tax=Hyaloperonospora brassicae TaxID=162125 RepID=A0AAV0SWM5_HYABA|nr:unnamed protein product [Hyaloperonospora brassicae]